MHDISPKVSVIIPVFNAAAYLRECLDSVRAQSLQEIEIICVDDASTDDSPELLKKYAKEDARISVLEQNHTQYAGVARNLGLTQARGEYVIFWDADDFFEPNALKLMYEQCKSDGADICICGANSFDAGTMQIKAMPHMLDLSVLNGTAPFSPKHYPNATFTISSPAPWNKMFRRKLIAENNLQFQALPRANDLFFVMLALALASSITYVDRALINYRRGNQNSLQNNNDRTPFCFFEALGALKAELTKRGTIDVFREAFEIVSLGNCMYNLASIKNKSSWLMVAKRLKHEILPLFRCARLQRANCPKNFLAYYDSMQKLLSENESDLLVRADKRFGNSSNRFKFSIIIPFHNTGIYLSEALASITKQTAFAKQTQIILIDDGSTDDSSKIAKKFFEENRINTVYIEQENQGAASARNAGLEKAEGEWIAFLDSDDKFATTAFKHVARFASKNPEISLIRIQFKLFEKTERLHLVVFEGPKNGSVVELDSNEALQYGILGTGGAFFRNSYKYLRQDTRLTNGEDSLFFAEIMLLEQRYAVIPGTFYLKRIRFSNNSITNTTSQNPMRDWPAFELGIIEPHRLIFFMENGCFKPIIQKWFIDSNYWFIKLKTELDALKDPKALSEYLRRFSELLQLVEDDIILSPISYLTDFQKHALVSLKHEGKLPDSYNSYEARANGEQICLVDGKERAVANLDNLRVKISNFNVRENGIEMVGTLSSLFDPTNISIHVQNEKAEQIETGSINPAENLNYFCGIKIYRPIGFRAFIPYEFVEGSKEIVVVATILGITKRLNLNFTGFYVNLTNTVRGQWNRIGNKILTYRKIDRCIKVSSYNAVNVIKNELLLFKSLVRHYFRQKRKSLITAALLALKLIFVRIAASITQRANKMRLVNVFMDRLNEADDSAEALIMYAESQIEQQRKDSRPIKNFFVIQKNSTDYRRLKANGVKVVEYKSFKHLILMMQAKNLITSSPDNNILHPFVKKYERLLNDKIHYNLIVPAHGVCKEDLSWYLDYTRRNTRLFVTVSERQSKNAVACYNLSENNVKSIGLPRFDRLLNNDQAKKYILLMPTWDNRLTHRTADGKLIYNQSFKESLYFAKWNEFLNNERLHNLLKRYNYKILFNIHPNLKEQVQDFAINPDFVCVPNDGQLSALKNDCSCLITDYSSIAFDFAYSQKPVIYYQFQDYHYDRTDAYFQYARDGFGPVLVDPKELVDSLEALLQGSMIQPDMYQKRVADFYTFIDKNNSKRVWDEILRISD